MAGRRDHTQLGFSMKGAARAFGVDHGALRDAIRSGELSAARIGAKRLLILRVDVEAWVRKHRVELKPAASEWAADAARRAAERAAKRRERTREAPAKP